MGGSHRSQVWASRTVRAAFCRPGAYREAAKDEDGTWQAVLVVVLATVSVAAVDLAWEPAAIAWQAFATFLHWGVWTAITCAFAKSFTERAVSWREVLRALGFARAPELLAALAAVPYGGGLIKAAIIPWTLATGTAAVRETLNLSPGKALLVALAGILPYWLALAVLY